MNTRIYDLYGVECNDIETARFVIEDLLNMSMIAHDSIYRGVYYRFNSVGQENFILQNNYNDFEEEWTEKRYSKYPLLLYVNETQRSSEVASLLQSDNRVVRLKSQEL